MSIGVNRDGSLWQRRRKKNWCKCFGLKNERGNVMKKLKKNQMAGITLIALVVTIIVNRVFYDKNIKYNNLVGSSLWFI